MVNDFPGAIHFHFHACFTVSIRTHHVCLITQSVAQRFCFVPLSASCSKLGVLSSFWRPMSKASSPNAADTNAAHRRPHERRRVVPPFGKPRVSASRGRALRGQWRVGTPQDERCEWFLAPSQWFCWSCLPCIFSEVESAGGREV